MKKLSALFGLLVAVFVSPAGADDFYQGKQISVFVGAAPGSAHHIYALLLADRLGEYIPGHPSVHVQLVPNEDANGLKTGSYLAGQALRDGTVIGTVPMSGITPLLDIAARDFDPQSLLPLGSVASGTRVCAVASRTGVKTFEDTRANQIDVGTVSNSAFDQYSRLLVSLAGANFHFINNYRSTSQMLFALERGDIGGVCGVEWNNIMLLRPSWLTSDAIRFILQMGPVAHSRLSGFGKVPDIELPDVRDYVHQEDIPIIDYVTSELKANRSYFAPPDVPAERVEVLRNALGAVFKDPSFLEEAHQRNLPVEPLSGSGVETILQDLYGAPAELVARAKRATAPSQ